MTAATEPAVVPVPTASVRLEWSGALMGVLALALAGAALVVAATEPKGDLTALDVVLALLIAAWAIAGAVVAGRGSVLGRTVLLGAGTAGLAFLVSAMAAEPGEDTLRAVAVLGTAMLPAFGLHLLLGLPEGDLGSRSRSVAAWSGYGAAAMAGIMMFLADRSLLGWVLWLEGAVALTAGLGPAHRRYLVSAGLQRQRLQWLGCGIALTAGVALVLTGLWVLLDWPTEAGLVATAATVLVPLSLLGGSTPLVSRADRLLVATVSISGLTGVVLGVYLFVVIGLGRAPSRDERTVLVLSMIAAAVAALLYLPARERLSEMANRLVYGERHAPDEAIRTFGSRLSRAVPMDELLLQLAESLRKTMSLSAAEIWTGTDGRYDRAVSVPDRGTAVVRVEPEALPVVTRAGVAGNAWIAVWLPELLKARAGQQVRVAPISHSGELLGLIVLDRPGDGDAFKEEDDQALGELARQVGLALHNVNLDSALQESLDEVRRYAVELQASRARIVATADSERRNIERNLHDGAQQHLVALAVSLRLTRDLVTEDPESATEMLDALAQDVKDTIQQLRDLAHGIYPPLLMDSGLSEALRAAAARSPFEVSVDASVGRYTTEMEAAVYFCCLEALQNAAKHAPDAHVDVRIWQSEEPCQLCFEVSDDGPGFDPAEATSGHGFVNMNDRLGAIGGEVSWQSIPGEGATVSGRVPC